jgi:hypothetical protein
MVVKRCPTCLGAGHVALVKFNRESALVSVNLREILSDLRAKKPTRWVAEKHRISKGTVYKIGNGTWAGFRQGAP